MYTLLLFQVIAHLLADYIFQSQKWCDKKDERIITFTHVWHFLIVFVLSWGLSFHLNFYISALYISLIHVITDMAKSYVHIYYKKDIFFIDQLVHLVIILILVWSYSLNNIIEFPFEISIKTATIITAYILCLKPANIIICLVIGKNNDKASISAILPIKMK